jgi:hypothetical protein
VCNGKIVICMPAMFQPCLLATHEHEVIPKQAKKSRYDE